MYEKCLIKLFDDFFQKINGEIELNPNYSVQQMSNDMYLLTIAVPGYKKNNLRIIIEDGVLTISGVLNKFSKENTGTCLYDGFVSKSFENRFSLNDRLNLVAANLAQGLLHVVLKDRLGNNEIRNI